MRDALVWALVLSSAAPLFAGADGIRAKEALPQPRIMAWQGIPGLVPGNTPASFEEAVRRGATGLWVEVRKTQDDQLVVLPNDRVDYSTDAAGLLTQFCYDEILTMRAGYFGGGPSASQRIVMLDDLLEFAVANDLWLVFDVRAPGARTDIQRRIESLNPRPKVFIWGLAAEAGPGAYGGQIRMFSLADVSSRAMEHSHRYGESTAAMAMTDDRRLLRRAYVRGLDMAVTPYPGVVAELALATKGVLPHSSRRQLASPVRAPTFSDELKAMLGSDASALARIMLGRDRRKSRRAAIALAQRKDDIDVRKAILQVLAEKDEDARSHAALAAGLTGCTEAVPALSTMLSSGGVRARRDAALALARIGTEPACEMLAITLEKDADTSVRVCAAKGLAHWNDARAVYALRNGLESGNPVQVRTACATALGLAHQTEAIEDLYLALATTTDAESEPVRDAAGWALSQMGKRAVPALLKVLADETEANRRRATWALVRMGEECLSPLRHAFHDPSPEVRRRALIAYGWIGSSEIDYIVAWLVDDEDAVVRETAAWALGMCQSKEGAKAIARRIPEERDRVARTVMQRALRRLRLPEDNGP